MSRQQLLKTALTLVEEHGFTRHALSLSALSLSRPHKEPLSDTAVSALFGNGDDARRTLLNEWLAEGRRKMCESEKKDLNEILKHRLKWNEKVLGYLPEAFAMAMSPSLPIPPLDPLPALRHISSVADEACFLAGDKSTDNAWYGKRAAVSAAYGAAELHQLSSPNTAAEFLDDLLRQTQGVESSVANTLEFARYMGRSWVGIYRSLGLH